MVKQKPIFKVIKVREQEYKKLKDYKVHPKQTYWEILKELIERDGKNKKSEE